MRTRRSSRQSCPTSPQQRPSIIGSRSIRAGRRMRSVRTSARGRSVLRSPPSSHVSARRCRSSRPTRSSRLLAGNATTRLLSRSRHSSDRPSLSMRRIDGQPDQCDKRDAEIADAEQYDSAHGRPPGCTPFTAENVWRDQAFPAIRCSSFFVTVGTMWLCATFGVAKEVGPGMDTSSFEGHLIAAMVVPSLCRGRQ